MNHFKDIISSYNLSNVSNVELIRSMVCLYSIFDFVEEHDKCLFWKAMRNFHEHIKGGHFDEMYAKYQVENMYHTKRNGNVCRGEVYSIEDSKKLYEKHIRNINNEYTCWDVYVAINAQYHDYVRLYSEWYPNITSEELDTKIINSAITFWFKDEDAGVTKVWDYFKNIN